MLIPIPYSWLHKEHPVVLIDNSESMRGKLNKKILKKLTHKGIEYYIFGDSVRKGMLNFSDTMTDFKKVFTWIKRHRPSQVLIVSDGLFTDTGKIEPSVPVSTYMPIMKTKPVHIDIFTDRDQYAAGDTAVIRLQVSSEEDVDVLFHVQGKKERRFHIRKSMGIQEFVDTVIRKKEGMFRVHAYAVLKDSVVANAVKNIFFKKHKITVLYLSKNLYISTHWYIYGFSNIEELKSYYYILLKKPVGKLPAHVDVIFIDKADTGAFRSVLKKYKNAGLWIHEGKDEGQSNNIRGEITGLLPSLNESVEEVKEYISQRGFKTYDFSLLSIGNEAFFVYSLKTRMIVKDRISMLYYVHFKNPYIFTKALKDVVKFISEKGNIVKCKLDSLYAYTPQSLNFTSMVEVDVKVDSSTLPVVNNNGIYLVDIPALSAGYHTVSFIDKRGFIVKSCRIKVLDIPREKRRKGYDPFFLETIPNKTDGKTLSAIDEFPLKLEREPIYLKNFLLLYILLFIVFISELIIRKLTHQV